MSRKSKKQRKLKSRVGVLALAVIVLIFIGGGAWYYRHHHATYAFPYEKMHVTYDPTVWTVRSKYSTTNGCHGAPNQYEDLTLQDKQFVLVFQFGGDCKGVPRSGGDLSPRAAVAMVKVASDRPPFKVVTANAGINADTYAQQFPVLLLSDSFGETDFPTTHDNLAKGTSADDISRSFLGVGNVIGFYTGNMPSIYSNSLQRGNITIGVAPGYLWPESDTIGMTESEFLQRPEVRAAVKVLESVRY